MENMEGLNGKKILVTGGTGFIGGHLVEELIKRFSKVLVVDRLLDRRSTFYINKLAKKTKLEFFDISNRTKFEKLVSSFKPEYIFHLAAEAIVGKSFNNPYKTFKTNVMGTVSVLEAARKNNGIKGIIVASSDKAYGKTKTAYTEESPIKGDHPYDVSKSCTDLIAYSYYKTYHLPVAVTRFGNVYGEGDFHFNRIIPGICESVIENKTLLIRSDGTYVRDYVYVKDVVDGYLILLKKIDGIKGEAFNFSSTDTYSVLDLIKKSEKILKTKIKYKILNIAKNEIPYQHLNSAKIRKLGWKSAYSVEKVLPEIVDWYKKIV